ncbi:MAG: ABC transporter ATP-binding protein [Actinomycetota bacterium]
MAASGIDATGVRRTFGDVVAVADVDLTVPTGQVTALVGPNGAGKTTLLLVLATVLTPDAGKIRVAGFDPVTESVDVRARTGWMPDSFGTYETLTAREVLEFVAAAYRIPKRRRARRAWELLALVHLDEYAESPIHVLSRGQKQRLGLARALVHEPTVLLLDEPAAGLDPRSRIELRGLLRGLAAQGCAVLVSSHVLSELETTADRVVFVDRGRSVADHSLAELSRPERRPWRVKSLDPESLMAFLDHNGTEHGPLDGHGVEVLLQGDEAAAELLAAMVRDEIPIVSFAPAGSSLEEAYLAMTEERR